MHVLEHNTTGNSSLLTESHSAQTGAVIDQSALRVCLYPVEIDDFNNPSRRSVSLSQHPTGQVGLLASLHCEKKSTWAATSGG